MLDNYENVKFSIALPFECLLQVSCLWVIVLDNFLCHILCPEILLQFFNGLNITADQKKFLRKALHAYYDAAAELLQSEHSVRH